MTRSVSLRAIGLLGVLVVLCLVTGAVQNGPVEAYSDCEPWRTTGPSWTGGGGELMEPVGLNRVVRESDLVFEGKVERMRSCLSSGTIVTLVELSVASSFKGSADRVTITVPGGRHGDYGYGAGSPEFVVGEDAFIAGQHEPGFGIVLTSGHQSKLRINASRIVEGVGLDWIAFADRVRNAVNGSLAPGSDPLSSPKDSLELGESEFLLNPERWEASTIPLAMYLNGSSNRPAQISVEDLRQSATNALNTWQDVSGSFIAFQPLQNTSRVSGADGCSAASQPDGFNDTTWGISTSHASSTLMRTSTCYIVSSGVLLDADVEIDTDHFGPDWRIDFGPCGADEVDLETVLLHEYGHAIGLGHPSSNDCVKGTNGNCPVMNALYGGVQHSVCTDDIAGVRAAYPEAPTIWGNVDCSADGVTTRDNQAELRFVLQQNPLSQSEPCPDIGGTANIDEQERVWGDEDCDGEVTTRDNQAKLRYVLQQNPLSQSEPCPDVGQESQLS